MSETYLTADLAAEADLADPTPIVLDFGGTVLTQINGVAVGPNRQQWTIEQIRVITEPEIPCVNIEITVWIGGQMVTLLMTAGSANRITITDPRPAN